MLSNINFRVKFHKSKSTLNILILTLKSAGSTSPEHAVNSLMPCFKNSSNFKIVLFKSTEITSKSRMVPFDVPY